MTLKTIINSLVEEGLTVMTIKEYNKDNKQKAFRTSITKMEKGKRGQYLAGNEKEDDIYRVEYPDLNLYYRLILNSPQSPEHAVIQLFSGRKQRYDVFRKIPHLPTESRESLLAKVNNLIQYNVEQAIKNREYKESRKVQNSAQHGIKVGDIFSSSWGYSMTIASFYKITKVSPSGKTATFIEIEKERSGGDEWGQGSFKSVPITPHKTRRNSKEKRSRLQFGGAKGFYIMGNNDEQAYIWDGKPVHENHDD